MDSAVSDLVASLRGVDSVGPQWDVVDSWVRDGELELLLDAARALSGPPPTAVPKWAADSVLGRIARVMALTPRPGFAKATSQIARLVGARELAALAASAQDLEACATLVGEVDEQDAEFTACLVQELVLREEDLEREPFSSFWRLSVSRGHPLCWLRLRLLHLETSISLPSYSLTGSAAGLPYLPEEELAERPDERLMAPVASETTTPEEAARIAAAVDTWLEDSNGHAETRTFALDTDKPGQALAEVLSRAELEFIGSGGVDKADSIPAELAFSALFAAASSGGAYDRGRYGAYGRLSAWQSVGGLVGANPSETIEAVAEMAEQSRWFRFDSEWFHHVAWDVGLAVVSADGARLALLAATDTD